MNSASSAAATASPTSRFTAPTLRVLGRCAYAPIYDAMRRYTAERDAHSADEFWLVEHEPVYTLGQAGKPEHLLRANGIPVVHIDRGGQITYHGPGQCVVYTLIDLRRRNLGVRTLVRMLEQATIDLLADFHIVGARREGAPGVYVEDAKIAALGLRVRNGACYHGIALNVDMDLRPFDDINPCGYAGLRVTQLADHGAYLDVEQAGRLLAARLAAQLSSAR